MARKTGGLLKIAAMLGLAVAAKQLSKKENRDAVKNEYNKAKENPKDYAQNIQEKVTQQAGEVQEKVTKQASEVQEKAMSEYDKVKQDPKGYAQNVQEKVTKQAGDYQQKAKSEFEKAKQDPKGYAQEAQQKAKTEYEKAKEDPKGYTEDVREKAESEMEKAKEDAGQGTDSESNDNDDSDLAADDKNQPGNQNTKVSPTQGKSSEENEHYTKPDRMDAEGQLTTEQMNNEWVSEGSGVHPQEDLQDAVSHGEGLNKDYGKLAADDEDIDIIQDQGEKDDNHNIHVVTDDDLNSDNDNKK